MASLERAVAQLRINDKLNRIDKENLARFDLFYHRLNTKMMRPFMLHHAVSPIIEPKFKINIVSTPRMYGKTSWMDNFTKTMAEWHAQYPAGIFETKLEQLSNGDFKLIAKARVKKENNMGYYAGRDECAEAPQNLNHEGLPSLDAHTERLVFLAQRNGENSSFRQRFNEEKEKNWDLTAQLERSRADTAQATQNAEYWHDHFNKAEEARRELANKAYRATEAKRRATAKAKKATKKPAVKK